jgi:hypothetical protein
MSSWVLSRGGSLGIPFLAQDGSIFTASPVGGRQEDQPHSQRTGLAPLALDVFLIDSQVQRRSSVLRTLFRQAFGESIVTRHREPISMALITPARTVFGGIGCHWRSILRGPARSDDCPVQTHWSHLGVKKKSSRTTFVMMSPGSPAVGHAAQIATWRRTLQVTDCAVRDKSR